MKRKSTSRKKTEKMLRSYHFGLETNFNSSLEAVFMIDMSGMFVYANKKALEITGYQNQDILGKNYNDVHLLPEEYLERAGKILSLNLSGQSTGPDIFELNRKDGSRIFVEFYTNPVTQSGIKLIIIIVQDITERKKAEEELRASKEFSTTILDCAPNPILVINPDTSIEYVNPAFEALTGFSLAEIAGAKPPFPWWPAETREEIGTSFKETVERGGRKRERVFQKKNGERMWVEANSAPVIQSGELKYFLINWTDLTRRKRYDQAFRESEEKFRNLFEHARDAVFVADADTGILLEVNPAGCAMLGLPKEQIIGKHQTMMHPPELFKKYQQLFLEHLKKGTVPSEDIIIRRADGKQLPVNVSASVVKLGDKTIIQGVFRDISSRKRAEQALKDSEEKFSKAFISSANAVCIITLPDNKFVEVNESYTRFTGYTREEIIGRTADDLNLWVKQEELKQWLDTLQKDGRVFNQEFSSRHKSGEIRICLGSAQVINIGGKPCRIVVITDITDRKRMEQELLEYHSHLEELVQKRTAELSSVNEQLEAELEERKRIGKELAKAKDAAEVANQAKSEFLAHMSHEIRTPIHGIIGSINLVLDSKLEPEQHQYLGMALSSADALQGVINDILDLSKIEAGQMEMAREDFKLRAMLEDVVETLAVDACKKGLEITSQMLPGVPKELIGDAGRLRQVLTNLLGNAVKFTDRGEIAVRVEVVANDNTTSELHFSVRDTGIGIPPDKQSIIFDPFRQADGSINRKYGGTGLGLTISRHLINNMGGRIWVESTPGQGSTFHFTAKYVKQTLKKAGSPAPAVPPALQGLPVLLVDDNATSRLVLKELINGWGLKVTEAESGPAALQELENAKGASLGYRAILIDKSMPGMDGYTLGRHILNDPAPQPAIIMMLPPECISNDFHHCQEEGILNYMVKPVRKSKLLEAVQKTLGVEPAHQEKTGTAIPGQTDGLRLHILVAEDNATSQLIARKTLEKMGHTVEIANNGLEATRLVEQRDFDLVLMDGEMPIMNGLEATRQIRQKENNSGRHVPIIAMTAYAMKEDRDRCMEAGMDAYLSKPARPDKIISVIRGLFSRGKEPARAPAVNMDAAMKVFGDDKELLKEAAGVFLEQDYPEQIIIIKNGISRQDTKMVRAAAHSIKGAARSLGGLVLGDIAMRLEEVGRNGDLNHAEALTEEIEIEVKRLADFFSIGKTC